VRRRVSLKRFQAKWIPVRVKKTREIDTGVSHTSQTLASGKRQRPPGTVLANPTMKIVRASHNGTSGGHGIGGRARFWDTRNTAQATGSQQERGDDGQDLQHMG
jgi:hypothetical protein